MSNPKLSRRQDSIEDSGANVNVNVTVPLSNFASQHQDMAANIQIPHTSCVASSFSSGGGPYQLTSIGKFAMKKVGRGTRNEIYGSARYGSGYGTYEVVNNSTKYTPDLTLNVTGRDFPHGFPPLAFHGYSGGNEYLDNMLSFEDYPGIAVSDNPHFNTRQRLLIAKKENQTYFIIADGETVNILNKVLQLSVAQGGCSIAPVEPQLCDESYDRSIIEPVTATNNDTYTGKYHSRDYVNPWPYPDYVYPWNVLQYYRGSSVALGRYDYDNVFAHNGNNNTDYWARSPVNTTGVDMEYLSCLNTTIAAVIPIINPNLIIVQRGDQITPGLNQGLVAGSVVGTVAALVLVGAWVFLRRRRNNKQAPAPITEKVYSQQRSSTAKDSAVADTDGHYGHHHVALADDASSTYSHEKKHHV